MTRPLPPVLLIAVAPLTDDEAIALLNRLLFAPSLVRRDDIIRLIGHFQQLQADRLPRR